MINVNINLPSMETSTFNNIPVSHIEAPEEVVDHKQMANNRAMLMRTLVFEQVDDDTVLPDDEKEIDRLLKSGKVELTLE